jgi:hypothetical protein
MLKFAMQSLNYDKPFAVFEQLGLAPLLEFHDHIRVPASAPVNSRQHYVSPLAGERKLVFNQHLNVAEAGIYEVVRQYREATPPGLPL